MINSLNTSNINNNLNNSENNQVFDNILRDVIHVTADQRINTDTANSLIQIQDMPLKLKGLLEPSKNQLNDFTNLGVVAPLSVLAAQPPFLSDIKLISNFALEANSCINNFTLQIPNNVAFNFNPVI
jgi:hypothetical protein